MKITRLARRSNFNHISIDGVAITLKLCLEVGKVDSAMGLGLNNSGFLQLGHPCIIEIILVIRT